MWDPEAPANILVFRNELLRPSETFVKAQAEAMTLFKPHYLGSVRREGPKLPPERVHLLHGEGWSALPRRLGYYLWGLGPQGLAALQRLRPRLLHAHFGPDGVTALPLARKLGIPLAVTFHGYDATTRDDDARRSFFRHRLYLRRRGLLQREAALFVAVSRFIRGKLLEQGYPEHKVVVHYVGVDTAFFSPEEQAVRQRAILFVGRLHEVKGCADLIHAMAIVQQLCPEAQLVIIGDGPLRRELERLAASRVRNVRFLGAAAPDDVRREMGLASVLCAPSVTCASGNAEAFGLVALEAQAMELPVVASRSGGLPEAVSHGETGFLVEERDVYGLARHIGIILADPGLGRRLGEAGRRRVRALFDLHAQTKVLGEHFLRLIAEQPYRHEPCGVPAARKGSP